MDLDCDELLRGKLHDAFWEWAKWTNGSDSSVFKEGLWDVVEDAAEESRACRMVAMYDGEDSASGSLRKGKFYVVVKDMGGSCLLRTESGDAVGVEKAFLKFVG